MKDTFWLNVARSCSWSVPVAAFFLVATWETVRPRVMLLLPATTRWASNFGLFGVYLLISIAALGAGYTGVAIWAGANSWGVWQSRHVPEIFRFVVGIAAMDLAGYAYHLASHKVEWMWRLHETHHSDPDYDLSTGVRFHPVEAILRTLCTSAAILLCAVPASAAVVYSLLAEVLTFIEHANAIVPDKVDRAIRSVFISTNAHRNHHSVDLHLQQSNYGIVLSVWDRIFRTWTEPADVNEFGVTEVAHHDGANFLYLLKAPFASRWSNKARIAPERA